MIYKGKYKIIDNFITVCDYDFILKKIEEGISKKSSLLISPIASHTLVRAHCDNNLKKILDKFDYLVPDSQWVRWSIPYLYGKEKGLEDRVYGPNLMLKSCGLAEEKNYKIFLYGNKESILEKLKKKLDNTYPSIKIVGEEASKFKELTKNEWHDLIKKITNSKANIIIISLGSPKQEVFSLELFKRLKKPLVIIPVGAAFDFISGHKPQASKLVQNLGMEWLFRLLTEPRRLFFRYIPYGANFIFLILYQKIKLLFKNQN